MKYAQEIIDLMGAYPGRDFRMREIVRYVAGNHPSYEERRRVRAQIANVIRELEAMGCLSRHMPASQRGRYTLYRWCSCKVLNQVSESANLSANIRVGQMRPQNSEARLVLKPAGFLHFRGLF